MTHATITPNTPILCTVEFPYDEATKNIVKELAGATYANSLWTLPIMHLPTLKGIFATLTVDPAVVTAYHALLRKMLRQLEGQHRKGALGKAIADLLDKHAVGIAAIKKQDGLAGSVFIGMRNAVKVDARKKAMARNGWGKRKKVTS
jgi:hypothetical protein